MGLSRQSCTSQFLHHSACLYGLASLPLLWICGCKCRSLSYRIVNYHPILTNYSCTNSTLSLNWLSTQYKTPKQSKFLSILQLLYRLLLKVGIIELVLLFLLSYPGLFQSLIYNTHCWHSSLNRPPKHVSERTRIVRLYCAFTVTVLELTLLLSLPARSTTQMV